MRISTVLTGNRLRICVKVFERLFEALEVRKIMYSDQGSHRGKEVHINSDFSGNFLKTKDANYLLRHVEDYLLSTLETGDEEKLATAEIKEGTYEYLPPVAECPLYFGVIQNSPEFWRRNMRDRIDIGFVSGFARARGARIGHLSRVAIPAYTTSFRCGAELGMVIGKDAKNIPESRAMDYVFGYTCVNDMIGNCWKGFAVERNPNKSPSRFELLVNSYYGRCTQHFGPVGPYVITKDEVPDPYGLIMLTKQNGHIRDRSFTNAMLVGIERTISLLSEFVLLKAGSIVHMGTMGCDGITFNDYEPLSQVDYVEIDIERVGVLRNCFVDNRFGDAKDR